MTARDRLGCLLMWTGLVLSALIMMAVAVGLVYGWAHLVGLS